MFENTSVTRGEQTWAEAHEGLEVRGGLGADCQGFIDTDKFL
jgi:hypothetical protein